MDTYPQHIALDALLRGITIDEMVDVYHQTHMKRGAEDHRVAMLNKREREKYEAAKRAATDALSWWDILRRKEPEIGVRKPIEQQVDRYEFPRLPYYAEGYWHQMGKRRLAAKL